MMKAPLHKQAFSLVELSIVLVILGLLTGGILTGQSLIRAAELRAVTTEFQTYQTAVMTFRDKYFALPGDMRNATDFWGAMTNCGAASPSGSGTETCNGDGDGQIDDPTTAGQTGESFGFWRHLANAGLIEGTYTGISESGGSVANADVGVNVPASKLGRAGWTTVNFDDEANIVGTYGNVLFFGQATAIGRTVSVALSTEETWNIDTKIDDAKPWLGKVVVQTGQGSSGTNCANAVASSQAVSAAAEYELSNRNTLSCSIIFRSAF